ncbi:thiamine-phosphate kinase [Thioalkalivibrio denitrificans]|uniref:Thiamine-monophosphate kinase n=1 Tax=Thioalkalivibrio denitrificans TaxID=108003 RepID=A0A1V3NJC0_9GAMM|nr:thiamine-phosphate kinase [Thioalkalivibrio denitrificans]OOG25207.1 thiamine-phosphate kinase [Thioalkalivibrio denitrificans]
MSEFDLIRNYFTWPASREDVTLGVGDDGALLRVPPGQELVVCVDTLAAGVHFPDETPADALGHKALAVNLSDLAAMGAEPAWATLALTLPAADEDWVGAFSEGFRSLAEEYGVALVGGDTTRGPLSITVQVMGFVPRGHALRRDGARPGDGIYVTGTLGDAALGLRHWTQRTTDGPHVHALLARLMRPVPQVAAGLALRGLAGAAIDLSDGLLADLGHVLDASGTGAAINLAQLPLSDAFRAVSGDAPDWSLPLSGGDDYELLFTLAPDMEARAREVLPVPFTRIGTIEASPGIRVTDGEGQPFSPSRSGYRHFN